MIGHELEYVTDSQHIFMQCRTDGFRRDVTGRCGDWLKYYWHLHVHGVEVTTTARAQATA